MAKSTLTIANFRRIVWAHYKKQGRHDLPWRKTTDVYKILVSEVMLQQTQVERVIPFYKKFLRKFPTAQKLARASLPDVLRSWQGLGYNRRAKMLRDAAAVLAERSIRTVSELESLAGVGPYTARAISAFTWNQNEIFIETNIRTVIIHHFFPKKKKVSDAEIEKVLTQSFPKGRARDWYSALMDYGAYLKRSGISHNARGQSYTKQSTFKGSLREARGTILREYMRGVTSKRKLVSLLGDTRKEQMQKAFDALSAEGMINGNP
jgi:A/G-specific adenine glycosylase